MHVRSGCEDDFVAAFKDMRVLEAAREECGLVSARALQPSTRGEPFVVIGEWRTAEDYACWLDSAVRAQLSQTLDPLLDHKPGSGETYSPVDEL